MKQTSPILAFIFCVNTLCISQSNEISFGVEAAYHMETRTRTLETYGETKGDKIHSSTDFFGVGIVLQKQFADTWGISTGLSYVKRQYNSKVYFDHCYFGQPCEEDLKSVGNYGYKTIEIPFGISKYLFSDNKWEFYINLTINTAIDFQSYYYRGKTYSTNEIHLFSGSLIHNIGLTRKIKGRLKLTLEPFVRLVNIQRDDPILILSSDRRWTFFDNFGSHLLLLYSL